MGSGRNRREKDVINISIKRAETAGDKNMKKPWEKAQIRMNKLVKARHQ